MTTPAPHDTGPGSENPRFEASYARLFGGQIAADQGADAFFQAFYRRFLSDPEVAALFRNSDMQRQAAMLRRSFFHLAGFYVTHAPSSELERMSIMHHRLGIEPRLYDRWLNCLVATVAEHDRECDEVTELAWRLALTPGITFMKLYGHFAEGGR
jgi:truncated hemoglobin YjbI